MSSPTGSRAEELAVLDQLARAPGRADALRAALERLALLVLEGQCSAQPVARKRCLDAHRLAMAALTDDWRRLHGHPPYNAGGKQ